MEHDWPIIILASRDLLAEIQREQIRDELDLGPKPSRSELWIAECVIGSMSAAASAVKHRFTRDIRTNDCNLTMDRNTDVIWALYQHRPQLQLAALRLWGFYADIIFPLLLGPEMRWELVERSPEATEIRPLFPPIRWDDEVRRNALKLVDVLRAKAVDFEAAINGLAEAAGVVESKAESVTELVDSTGGNGPGTAQAPLLAALNLHHGYQNNSCKKFDPTGVGILARAANVSKTSASYFFAKHFGTTDEGDGFAKYKVACRNGQLPIILARINGDLSPEQVREAAEMEADRRHKAEE